MAGAPHKEGLDYFSLDVDFFENKKVRRIMRACGPSSLTVLTCLLCNIYRNKGYYIVWDEDLPFDIADTVGMSEGAVTEVITKAVQVAFFSPYQFQTNKVLTSPEIQGRYISATKKRSEVSLIEKYTVFDGNNSINDAGNSINGGDNEQSKVKDSKEKKSKVSKAIAFGGQEPPDRSNWQMWNELTEGFQNKSPGDIWLEVKTFIQTKNPTFVEPYAVAWNVFVKSKTVVAYKIPTLLAINDDRRKKLRTRLSEEPFDFFKVLERIKSGAHLKGDNGRGWKVNFDWIIENGSNYLKILEGNYD